MTLKEKFGGLLRSKLSWPSMIATGFALMGAFFFIPPTWRTSTADKSKAEIVDRREIFIDSEVDSVQCSEDASAVKRLQRQYFSCGKLHRTYETSEACEIASRFEEVVLFGDSLCRHTTMALLSILRGDINRGAVMDWLLPKNLECIGDFQYKSTKYKCGPFGLTNTSIFPPAGALLQHLFALAGQ